MLAALVSLVAATMTCSTGAGVTYTVEAGDVFVWNLTDAKTSSLSLYIKGTVNSTSGGTLSVDQEVFDAASGKYLTAAEFPTSIASSAITSKEGLQSIINNATLDPHFTSRVYAGRQVTCLSFQQDATNWGFIDNVTGVACEVEYSQGSSSVRIVIVSWENVDLSTYASFFTPTNILLLVTLSASAIALTCLLTRRGTRHGRAARR